MPLEILGTAPAPGNFLMLRNLACLAMMVCVSAPLAEEPATTQPKEETAVPAALNYKMKSLGGQDVDLSRYKGKVVLMVNVASQCGLTPQYKALEELHQKHKDKGLAILGFPANNFGAQEPGTNEEIAQFCQSTYSVEFPMFSKISVAGDDQHPLYRELTTTIPRAQGDPDAFREQLRGHGITPNEEPDIVW